METICNAPLPNGSNQCPANWADVKNIYVAKLDVAFDNISDLLNTVIWKRKVDTDLAIYLNGTLNSYEVTTDDPSIVTAENTGEKTFFKEGLPSATLNLATNFNDFKELKSTLKGGLYGVFYELHNGTWLVKYDLETLQYKPIAAKLNATWKGIPQPTDILNNFMLYVSHTESFDNVWNFPIDGLGDAIKSAMPNGATITEVVRYIVGTGTTRITLTDRKGNLITGAVLADFEIYETSYLDTPAITSVTEVVGLNGYYDIVLDVLAIPVPMTEGQWMRIIYKSLNVTVVTRISNRLKIVA